MGSSLASEGTRLRRRVPLHTAGQSSPRYGQSEANDPFALHLTSWSAFAISLALSSDALT